MLSRTTPTIINKLSDRKFGAGCDQLITINKSKGDEDVRIEIFNSNGDTVSGTLTIYATSTGEYRTSWIIPDDIEPGPIEIRVTSTGNTSSITITVN